MANKHIVEVVKPWTSTLTIGPLVVAGKEISPGTTKIYDRKIGDELVFQNIIDTRRFLKEHGDKVRYVGKRPK